MIWALAAILLTLWFLGMVTSHTMGGLVHGFLLLGLIAVLFQLFRGRDLITR